MSEKQTIRDQILELAARPDGIGSDDMGMFNVDDLSARCCGLVRKGILFRAGTGRGKIRYFSTAAAAQAYDQRTPKVVKAIPKPQPTAKAHWDKDAQVVITSKTKVTIYPPQEPRFYAQPVPFIHAGNQRGRV